MNTRRVIVQILGALLAVGAIALLLLMAWSIWRLRGFYPVFWLNAFSFTMVCFLLRNYFVHPPPSRPWSRPVAWFAVAIGIAAGGAMVSPTLNAWMIHG
jgi:hypothetical protein